MLKYKNLNNISDELAKEIPKLELGQEVVFQMLNGHPNNDNDRNERERQPFLYGKTQLQTKFRIRDPKSGNSVDVGVPMAVENDTVTSYRPFLAGQDDGVFNGKFSLFGGNQIHEELYEIFWLSPEREGSPCPDLRVKPVFKIVNHKEEATKAINKVDILRKALEDLKTMEDVHYANFGASQNWSETDIEFLKAKVSEFARSHPDKFLAIREDKATSIKANVKKAIDKQILTYDAITGDVLTGDSVVMKVAKDHKADYLGAIARWIGESKNGKQVYDGILKQLEN